MEDISVLKPQTMGPFTPFYKQTIPLVKNHPIHLYILTALIVVSLLYVLFGSGIVWLTSLLQHGF
jgi:hypothetical protein